MDKQIIDWLSQYSLDSGLKTFVVGISGGVDSALTSTLCAETGIKTIVVSMPIHQNETELARARNHIDWLRSKYDNVESIEIPLSHIYDSFARFFADDVN
jgi:NAD+ synthase